jgi:hypothetical protein
MAGTPEYGAPAGSHLNGEVKGHHREALDHLSRVFSRIERQRRRVFRETFPIRVRRILLLEVPAVRQHDPAEVPGSLRGKNASLEIAAAQGWQVARVVEMCVRQQHGIN